MMWAENEVLRKLFGSERKEATGDWKKSHSEKLRDPYSSPNTILGIKLREMGLEEMRDVWGKKRCIQDIGKEIKRKETTWKT